MGCDELPAMLCQHHALTESCHTLCHQQQTLFRTEILVPMAVFMELHIVRHCRVLKYGIICDGALPSHLHKRRSKLSSEHLDLTGS